jgi:Delta14-sterol reductase
VRHGTPLPDGSRLAYRLNGWPALWTTLAIAVVAVMAGVIPAGVAYEHFGPLLTTANLFTLVFAAWLWVRGRRAGGAGVTGNAVRDFFMGTELNPRVRRLDLKFFCETRPGLVLWALFTLSFAAAQWDRHHTITAAMLLVVAFQLLYVADCLYHEEAILTTWDIRHERFGWMLAWGSLVWVPFTYSLQAYYLVDHAPALSWPAMTALIVLNMAGYAIFRSANLQKHRFRQDPQRLVWGRPPRAIHTAHGPLLLTSGWWGLARHANYLGDLMMALAWCLTTGFRTPLTYFYVVYMMVLLVHRERRDHAFCLARYGADWVAYCRQVRWRIVPGLY